MHFVDVISELRSTCGSLLITTFAVLLGACGGGQPDVATTPLSPQSAEAAVLSNPGSDRATIAAFGGNPIAVSGPPVVFNYPAGARSGDVIGIQGSNFGTAPVVTLLMTSSTRSVQSAWRTTVPVINQVGTGWLAVRIPRMAFASPGWALSISNGTQSIAQPILLSAARPYHLDTTQLVPGGAFRIFGRNLRWPGGIAVVTVDGLAAVIDYEASNEHMLAVRAPEGLRDSDAAVIKVDNGIGQGATQLDRQIKTVSGAAGDPLGLGVGWAAAFGPLLNNVINMANDQPFSKRMVGDGMSDDKPALQAALIHATRNGGGVIRLPEGRCFLKSSVQLTNKTILQGSGMDRTELTGVHVYGVGGDLFAIRDLSLTDIGQSPYQFLTKTSSRVAVQRVRVNMPLANGVAVWMYSNNNIVIKDSEFLQTRIGANHAVNVSTNSGLVFTGNKIKFVNNTGSSFVGVRDAYIANNTWTRDAASSGLRDGHVTHTMVLEFTSRIAVIGNTLETINGQPNGNNDSEAILTEGGGPERTEGVGMVASSAASSITMNNTITGGVNPRVSQIISSGNFPENFGVVIIAGKGAGQARTITAYDAGSGTLQVDKPWDELPDTSSRFATAIWGIEKSLIKKNAISNSPAGIWLYGTASREVDIVENSLVDTGGIYLRSFQATDQKSFSPVYNVRVLRNSITNSATSLYKSYITIELSHNDTQAKGISHIGIEVRGNSITARRPETNTHDIRSIGGYGGFLNRMSVFESSQYQPPGFPQVLGTIFQSNTCTTCEVGFHLGSGAYGTVIFGNTLTGSGSWISDTVTAYSATAGRSVNTLILESTTN